MQTFLEILKSDTKYIIFNVSTLTYFSGNTLSSLVIESKSSSLYYFKVLINNSNYLQVRYNGVTNDVNKNIVLELLTPKIIEYKDEEKSTQNGIKSVKFYENTLYLKPIIKIQSDNIISEEYSQLNTNSIIELDFESYPTYNKISEKSIINKGFNGLSIDHPNNYIRNLKVKIIEPKFIKQNIYFIFTHI